MKKWIASWLQPSANSRPASQPVDTPKVAAASVPVAPVDTAPAYSQTNIDTLFWALLTPPGQQPPLAGIEALLLAEMGRLVESPAAGDTLIPRVPAVIPHLLRSLRDENVSGAELARQLSQDLVLVADILRVANSPLYRPATPVKTMESAVMLLGQNGLRVQLARLSFRPVISIQSGRFARVAAPHIWQLCERSAAAGTALAKTYGADPFESYLAGLVHNIGLIVVMRLADQIYRGDTLPQSEAFFTPLNATARQLSARIAALWEFPDNIVRGIGSMYHESVNATPLRRLLETCDGVSKLGMLVDTGKLAADDPRIAASLDEATLAVFNTRHHKDSDGD